MLEYQIPTEDLNLSQVFHKLEILRKTGSIEDYSVSQTTLDQVCFGICSNFPPFMKSLSTGVDRRE